MGVQDVLDFSLVIRFTKRVYTTLRRTAGLLVLIALGGIKCHYKSEVFILMP